MDQEQETAPESTGTGSADAADAEALAGLRWGWDTAYRIGYDEQRGWWAARRDQIGALLTADSADGLGAAILADYTQNPVPRDLPRNPR